MVGQRIVDRQYPLLPRWSGLLGTALRRGAASSGVILAYLTPFVIAYWVFAASSFDVLATKSRERSVVSNKLPEQDLDRYVVADVYALRAIDHTHPALAQLCDQLIFAVDDVTDQRIDIEESNSRQGRLVLILVVRVRNA